MKEKTRYTDEPMKVGRLLRDFLPPPEKLVLQDKSVKVTISLSARSVHFFKAEAAKVEGQYQRMIRSVLDAYVAAFELTGKGNRTRKGATTSAKPGKNGTSKVVIVTKDARHLKGLVAKPAKPVTVGAMNRAVARAGSRK